MTHGLHISFVTYTYNDHDNVHTLLRYMQTFPVPFSQVIVVDDGSKEPYSAPKNYPYPVTVLRQENKGPGLAKKVGLSAATGDIIFSVDADIRPHKDWLAHALTYLADASVGMVGGACTPALGRSAFARALHKTRSHIAPDSEASFLFGGCLLMRQAAWQQVGRLDNYDKALLEDFFLSGKMREAGFRLILCSSFSVYETRHLHRAVYYRRNAWYLSSSLLQIIQKHGMQRFWDDSVVRMAKGLEYFTQSGDPILIYMILLHVCAMLCQVVEDFGEEVPYTTEDILKSAAHAVQEYPKIRLLLQQDLQRVGMQSLPEQGKEDLALTALLAPAQEAGALASLESRWVDVYLQEDATLNFETHYLQESYEK